MLPVFPIAYFGSIDYFRKMCSQQKVLIDTKEHFVKQTIRSRCHILGPNDVQRLSVPVIKHHGSHTPMDQILVDDSVNWRKNHWKTIETAYASSPFFDYYGMEVEEIISDKRITSLIDLNLQITQRVFKWLDLEVEINFSTEYISQTEYDYRNYDFGNSNSPEYKPYTQVFRSKEEHVYNLSILDAIFNEGPLARNLLDLP